MTPPASDKEGMTPACDTVVSLADVRARRDAHETMLEMVRELARQTAIAHHEAAMRDLT